MRQNQCRNQCATATYNFNMKVYHILFVVLVVVACSTPSLAENRLAEWLKKVIFTNNQAAITKKIQEVTIKGDEGRKKRFGETLNHQCKQYKPSIDDFKPEMITGKFYATLRATDLFRNNEVAGNVSQCFTYDVSANADGSFKFVETSYTSPDGSDGKQVLSMKLTRTKDGKATFATTTEDGKPLETGYSNVQLLNAKVGDYWYMLWCKNNDDGKTSIIKSLLVSKTPEYTTDAMLGFHDSVIFKNLDLNLHPRLFHMYNEKCPKI